MNDRQQHPLSVLCGVWERESAKGNIYYVGRIGDMKVLILPNRDHVDGDSKPTHNVCLVHSPRPPK